MKRRSAIKTDLFADELHRKKIDSLGDPLAAIESHIDFTTLATEVDRIAPRPVSTQGGRPPYPTETMVRILVLKRLYNLSDEQMEYQLLDRMSYKRFCGLSHSATIPDRTTIWIFEQRIGEAGAQALFDGVSTRNKSSKLSPLFSNHLLCILRLPFIAPHHRVAFWIEGDGADGRPVARIA